MIRIRDLSLPPDGDMARLVQAAARQLRISPNEIKQLDLKKKSVDARKKKRRAHHLHRRCRCKGPGR